MTKILITLFFSLQVLASGLVYGAERNSLLTMPELDQQQLQWLGLRIYQNECNRRPACLLSWNPGEDFPSLGIGHFIWYRADQQEAFEESFPGLIMFLREQGANVPQWLFSNSLEQPWPDRDSFLSANESHEQQSLAALLAQTTDLQSAYILKRFEHAVLDLLAANSSSDKSQLQDKMTRLLANDPLMGAYAMIDYVHFKGSGTKPSEQYQGAGWGLLQVLQNMPTDSPQPIQDFVDSARQVLTDRVNNAPVQRNEQRWLQGWHNRLATYLPQ